MSTKVFMDLDGTLFDLYGKENWLELLQSEDPTAFEGDFLPEISINKLFEMVQKLSEFGVIFEVITWLPMNASPEYEKECEKVKTEWVNINLPFISKITCQSYGIPKQNAIDKRAKKMYLIDDNTEICKIWETAKQRTAININKEFTVVNALEKIYKEILEGF